MRKHKKLILIPAPLTVDYPYQVKELHNMVTPKIGEYVSERDAIKERIAK